MRHAKEWKQCRLLALESFAPLAAVHILRMGLVKAQDPRRRRCDLDLPNGSANPNVCFWPVPRSKLEADGEALAFVEWWTKTRENSPLGYIVLQAARWSSRVAGRRDDIAERRRGVEAEVVVARVYFRRARGLEDGLEADALVADVARVGRRLCGGADGADGEAVALGEAEFVVGEEQLLGGGGHAQRRRRARRVGVVVG
eukprot:6210449-Pleurochrysis_carterae.AAC.1